MTRFRFLAAALFLIGFIVGDARAQGVYLVFSPGLEYVNPSYESPWQDVISYNPSFSISGGADIGYAWQPRRSTLAIRFFGGIHYNHTMLSADVTSDLPYGEGYIVNKSFHESFGMIVVPVRVEFVYQSRYGRVMPGGYIGIRNSFVGSATGEAELVDGTTYSYDVPVKSWVPAASAGVLVDFLISRYMLIDVRCGYNFAFQSILELPESAPKTDEPGASLKLNGLSLSAGMMIRIR
jgi:hypothetical protein